MKKYISAMICISAFFLVFAFSGIISYAVDAPQSDLPETRILNSDTYYSYDFDTKTLVISGSGDTPDFSNTSGAEDSQPWHSWRSDGTIKHVIVEDGITSIGSYFFYFVSTADFSLPDTIKSFGVSSMGYTNSIIHLAIPKSTVTIGKNAFYGCTGLESVTIPSTVSIIGESAFQSCKKLESLSFEDMNMNVALGKKAFYACTSLLKVTFPKGASFGKYSFGYSKTMAGGTYDGAFMYVFRDSEAYQYASNNYIDYAFTIICGDKVNLSYSSSNLQEKFSFVFVPKISESYNFYSLGKVDVECSVTDKNGNVIASSNDISPQNSNFLAEMIDVTAGEAYTLSVSSIMSEGDFTVVLMPADISDFEFDGAVSISAPAGSTENYTFNILPYLEDKNITVKYSDGFTDVVPFSVGWYNGTSISYSDNQQSEPWSCGENTYTITIGGVSKNYCAAVEHTYTRTVVPPTTYDDGYTLYSCGCCGYSFKSDYVSKTGVEVTGKIVLMETPQGVHNENYPVSLVDIICDGKTLATTDKDGAFSVIVPAGTEYITASYRFGIDRDIYIPHSESTSVSLGETAIVCNDYNEDGCINAVDYAVIYDVYGEYDRSNAVMKSVDYNNDGIIDDRDWQFAKNYFTYQKLDKTIYNFD